MAEVTSPKVPEELTLESLSEMIKSTRAMIDQKCGTLQEQIDALKARFEREAGEFDSRLVKITQLIDCTMQHMQAVVQVVGKVSEELKICKEKGAILGQSVAINRQNMTSLNKYVQQVDKSWKQAQEEIAKLQESDEDNTSFRKKVLAILGIAGSALIWLFTGDNLRTVLDVITSIFSGSSN